jgi:isopentenyldiphosphate isomerase
MPKDEMLDIIDVTGKVLYSESRAVAHKDSLLHRVVALLSVNEINGEKYILFSQRSSSKNNFPLKFDFLSSGHLISGESIEDSTREFKEELGVTLNYSDLKFIGDFLLETEVTKKAKKYLIRELLSLLITKNISKTNFDANEIERIIYVKLSQLPFLLTDGASFYMEINNQLVESTFKIFVNDFVPAKGNFYNEIIEKVLKISKAL